MTFGGSAEVSSGEDFRVYLLWAIPQEVCWEAGLRSMPATQPPRCGPATWGCGGRRAGSTQACPLKASWCA